MWRVLNAVWLPICGLAVWEGLVALGALDPLFFPPPSQLVPAAWRLIQIGELQRELTITLSRLVWGFLIGVGSGLLVGVAMGAIGPVRRTLEPVVSALYTTPKMSLLPMVMLLVGVGDSSRILLVALGCFIMMAIHAVDAVIGISHNYLDLARNYGAGGFALFRRVYLPAAMPQIFTGLRLSLGRALMITVAVELVSCPDGLGSMIWMSWQTFATEKLYIGVVMIASLGALSHTVLKRLERVAVPWKA